MESLGFRGQGFGALLGSWPGQNSMFLRDWFVYSKTNSKCARVSVFFFSDSVSVINIMTRAVALMDGLTD